MEKITIEEAFRRAEGKEINIHYIFINQCKKCRKYFYEIDEEYSFAGDQEDFEAFIKDYPIIDLEDKISPYTRCIQCSHCYKPNCYEFIADYDGDNSGECPECFPEYASDHVYFE